MTAITTGAATAEQELLDLIARSYNEEDGFERVLMRYKVQAILPLIRDGGHALDVGCGYGRRVDLRGAALQPVLSRRTPPRPVAHRQMEGVDPQLAEALFEVGKGRRRPPSCARTALEESRSTRRAAVRRSGNPLRGGF